MIKVPPELIPSGWDSHTNSVDPRGLNVRSHVNDSNPHVEWQESLTVSGTLPDGGPENNGVAFSGDRRSEIGGQASAVETDYTQSACHLDEEDE